MQDLVKMTIAVVFMVLAVVLVGASVMPMVQDTLDQVFTDKADLERAKGERALLEATAAGRLEIDKAAARAVRADTTLVSLMVSGIMGLMVVQTIGMVFLLRELAARR